MTRFTALAGGDFALIVIGAMVVIGCWTLGEWAAGVWG